METASVSIEPQSLSWDTNHNNRIVCFKGLIVVEDALLENL